jgi:hypothetical protein
MPSPARAHLFWVTRGRLSTPSWFENERSSLDHRRIKDPVPEIEQDLPSHGRTRSSNTASKGARARTPPLVVTGDAVMGKLEELRAGLRAAGIAVVERIASPPAPRPSNGHRRPARGRRVSRSTFDGTGTVVEPPEDLLAQAQVFAPELTMDEYTAARLVASEHGSGSLAEMAVIVDSELNRAERRGKGLFESLTWKWTFGKQGKRRRASTRLDPYEIHLQVARDVLTGARRGVSQGATRFFNPRVQLAMARKGSACSPLVILERWAFGFPWLKVGGKRQGCELDRRNGGRELLEWVGEIEGVDATVLMLMRPALPGPEHVSRYLAAKGLIEKRLPGGQSHA